MARRVKDRVFLLILADDGAFAVPDDVRLVVLVEIHGEVGSVRVEDYPGLRVERGVVEHLVEHVVVPPVAHHASAGAVLPAQRRVKLFFPCPPVPQEEEKIKVLDCELFADLVQPVPQLASLRAAVGQLLGLLVFDKVQPMELASSSFQVPKLVLLLLPYLSARLAADRVMMQSADVFSAIDTGPRDACWRVHDAAWERFRKKPLTTKKYLLCLKDIYEVYL